VLSVPKSEIEERERGFYVSTVGRDESVIREYIQKQEEEDKRLDQLGLWR
jgi:REP-associated tyrosine transposase